MNTHETTVSQPIPSESDEAEESRSTLHAWVDDELQVAEVVLVVAILALLTWWMATMPHQAGTVGSVICGIGGVLMVGLYRRLTVGQAGRLREGECRYVHAYTLFTTTQSLAMLALLLWTARGDQLFGVLTPHWPGAGTLS